MNDNSGAASRRARFCCALAFLAGAYWQTAQADQIRIRMLDVSSSGPLAFEPGFVRAEPGDTIIFEPTQKGGHSTVSLLTPPGAKGWTGSIDKETRVTLDREGIYLYACAAHKMMGMVGVIQVGNPVNLKEARTIASAQSAKFVFNKDRFEREFEQMSQ